MYGPWILETSQMLAALAPSALAQFRLAAALAIALIYLLLDVFNSRNVPTVFAYATLVFGVVMTLTYASYPYIETSALVAIIVVAVGYVFYRIGQLGAADVIEFAAISLIIPVQGTPFLLDIPQFGFPLMLSLLINAGVVALVMVIIYYLPLSIRTVKNSRIKGGIDSLITRYDILKTGFILAVYVVFAGMLSLTVGLSPAGIALIGIIAFGSIVVTLFERPLIYAMVRYVPVSKIEEGDIIETKLMGRRELASLKRSINGFDRLVTSKVLAQLKRRRVKKMLPVYKNAMPFAVPIFFGLVISILFGNLILLILPI
ncbi:MAG: peptidase A24A prepilin type IV [Candidatus Micrarchaeum acidiphilum ARMAN-2]|uniref:Peptidase A24A prepilin type IV n=1 Tax=Candidatus Micrarchaeum acidiphilum ARMAN-2 TaxID=425595 RepID=C7DGT5_MICA2|nr:MAG: peptidase A24A prepilin type IV [Candidatus Micrarchaeum acidiphilum ARMAN-2]